MAPLPGPLAPPLVGAWRLPGSPTTSWGEELGGGRLVIVGGIVGGIDGPGPRRGVGFSYGVPAHDIHTQDAPNIYTT